MTGGPTTVTRYIAEPYTEYSINEYDVGFHYLTE